MARGGRRHLAVLVKESRSLLTCAGGRSSCGMHAAPFIPRCSNLVGAGGRATAECCSSPMVWVLLGEQYSEGRCGDEGGGGDEDRGIEIIA